MRLIIILILMPFVSCNMKKNEKEIIPYRLNYKYTKHKKKGFYSEVYTKTDSVCIYSFVIKNLDSSYNYTNETQCYSITNKKADSIFYYRHYMLKLNSKIGDRWVRILPLDTIYYSLDTVLRDTFFVPNLKSKKVLVYLKSCIKSHYRGKIHKKDIRLETEYDKIYLDFEKKIVLKFEYYWYNEIIYKEELQEFMYIDTLDYDFSNCN